MANIKSAKKRAKQNVVKHQRNLARRTALKTAVKRVNQALEKGADEATITTLMNDVQAKFSRAKSKGVVHRNTAARKVSRLAKKVNAAQATK